LDKLHLIPKGSGFKVFNLVLSKLVLVQKQFGFCFEFSFKRRGRKKIYANEYYYETETFVISKIRLVTAVDSSLCCRYFRVHLFCMRSWRDKGRCSFAQALFCYTFAFFTKLFYCSH